MPEQSPEQRQDTTQSPRAPVLRNFSYPTSVGSSAPASSYTPREGQTTWDQLGELCNFSPDSVGKARTVEQPFFYRRDSEPYMSLSGQESDFNTSYWRSQVPAYDESTKGESRPGKNKRPGAILGLSLPHVHTKQAPGPDGGSPERETKSYRAAKTLSLGNYIFPRRNPVKTRRKHTSWGSSKGDSHLTYSRTCSPPHNTLARPVSSCGVLISEPIREHGDTGLGAKVSASKHRRSNTLISFQDEVDRPACSSSPSSRQFSRIGALRRRSGSQGRFSFDTTLLGDSEEAGRDAGRDHDDRKEGKGRWLSQLRDWISAPEPPTWTLKQHTKDAFKKAGVALRDLRTSAELHLPAGSLLSGPIDSRGPNDPAPELKEMVTEGREGCKREQQVYNSNAQMSQGSRSSTSQGSSLSIAAASSTTNDTEHWT